MQRSSRVAGASVVAIALTVSPACHARPALPLSAPTAADRLITPDQFGREVELRVGTTFTLPPPFEATGWQLDFSSEVIQLLTPADRIAAPGAEGWRFRAVAAGSTDVTLTASASPGSVGPPAPRRVSFTVHVR